MSQPFNPSNKPGTCKWCGRKLHLARFRLHGGQRHRGSYGDDTFCGLRCGYRFGLTMSKERQFKPKQP